MIYTVATVFVKPVTEEIISRAWGYYYSLDEAIQGINKHAYLLYECGEGKFLVIESVNPGITNLENHHEYWFKLNEKTFKYESIEKPNECKSIVMFSMG
jgi:hypothetical protein